MLCTVASYAEDDNYPLRRITFWGVCMRSFMFVYGPLGTHAI